MYCEKIISFLSEYLLPTIIGLALAAIFVMVIYIGVTEMPEKTRLHNAQEIDNELYEAVGVAFSEFPELRTEFEDSIQDGKITIGEYGEIYDAYHMKLKNKILTGE